MHGKSAPSSSGLELGMSGISAELLFCAETLRNRLGCLPFARFTESRRCDLPKDGERWRFTCDFEYSSGTGGISGGSSGSCTRSDSARNDSAFIQSA
jgi:hypothetical protein